MNQEDDNTLWNLLGKAERRKAPAGFAESVMARIAAEEKDDVLPVLDEGTYARSWWKWGSVAAGLAALLTLPFMWDSFSGASEEIPVASVQVDDKLLLDVAGMSLGSESLQDALCVLSSQESVTEISDSEMAGFVF